MGCICSVILYCATCNCPTKRDGCTVCLWNVYSIIQHVCFLCIFCWATGLSMHAEGASLSVPLCRSAFRVGHQFLLSYLKRHPGSIHTHTHTHRETHTHTHTHKHEAFVVHMKSVTHPRTIIDFINALITHIYLKLLQHHPNRNFSTCWSTQIWVVSTCTALLWSVVIGLSLRTQSVHLCNDCSSLHLSSILCSTLTQEKPLITAKQYTHKCECLSSYMITKAVPATAEWRQLPTEKVTNYPLAPWHPG